ncbi:hypothetical protein ACTD5D_40250 [Nocardia takedensis]|uniref:hypothetical protein n=1 Tax=Nocardia takedensis TaxID=259390 RepID=UPI003F76968C
MRTDGITSRERVTSQELRDNWLDLRAAAQEDGKVFVVTYWDRPVAVLMGTGEWRQAGATDLDEREWTTVTTKEGQSKINALTEDAKRGQHTVIMRRKSEMGVVVPFSWAQERAAALLPEEDQLVD